MFHHIFEHLEIDQNTLLHFFFQLFSWCVEMLWLIKHCLLCLMCYIYNFQMFHVAIKSCKYTLLHCHFCIVTGTCTHVSFWRTHRLINQGFLDCTSLAGSLHLSCGRTSQNQCAHHTSTCTPMCICVCILLEHNGKHIPLSNRGGGRYL